MRAALLLLALLAAGACRSAGSRAARGGELSAEWQGVRRGAFQAAARAVLCAETGIVELLAVRGDSGAGLVLFSPDSGSLSAGDYPVFEPTLPSEPRPGGLVSLRGFEEGVVVALHSTGGVVRVDVGGREASGTFEAGMRLHETADTVRVTGRFSRVRVEEAAAGCGATSRRDYV